jgi:hypothetical protein
MSPFRIAPAGASIKVVENLPDGRHASVGGFLTMIDAQEWLDCFLRLLLGRLQEERAASRLLRSCPAAAVRCRTDNEPPLP